MTTDISRVAYLGPEGTFTEQAALSYTQGDDDVKLVAFRSITDSLGAALRGDVDVAVVPYENLSGGGRVIETHNILFQNVGLRIYDEIILPVEHCLIAPKNADLSRMHIVASHPQALLQCQEYIKRRLPEAQTTEFVSTAQAVLYAKDKGVAAIASFRAAEIHGGNVVERGIEDNPHNSTRFVVARAMADHEPTGNDKTTLIFSVANNPGALVEALQCFVGQGIDLTRIESFSVEPGSSVAFFTVDCEGHRVDEKVKAAMTSLSRRVLVARIVGSYPKASLPA